MGNGNINILVFNCGSSSLTYKLFASDDRGNTPVILSGKATRVGVKGTEPSRIRTQYGDDITEQTIPLPNHRKAAALVLQYVADRAIQVDYIGHRFVHGGSYFQHSVFVNEQTLETLKLCQPLAPIHNPTSLSVIEECRRKLGEVRQYVAFDSAYHSSIPEVVYSYALPKRIADKFGFRKYGFHGLSYSYVVKEAARFLQTPLEELKIVACHLGTGGSSTVAIRDGHSIDTSMGYTPLPGLVMSTRCGDVDPMLAIYLSTRYGYRPEDLMDLFSKRSGLLGISGFSSDITDLLAKTSGEEKEQAELALNMYVHRLRKYIGSYIVELGGIDALLFTDDIGVRSWQVRSKVCQGMEWCGMKLDEQLNRTASPDVISTLHSKTSKARILSVPSNEELVICREGVKLIGNRNDPDF